MIYRIGSAAKFLLHWEWVAWTALSACACVEGVAVIAAASAAVASATFLKFIAEETRS